MGTRILWFLALLIIFGVASVQADSEFLFSFFIGVVTMTVFTLYGDGELIIRFGEQIKKISQNEQAGEKFHRKISERFGSWQHESNTSSEIPVIGIVSVGLGL